MKILAVRGELAAADFGWALGESVRSGAVPPNRATPAFEELALSGAHRETWGIRAEAAARKTTSRVSDMARLLLDTIGAPE